MHVQPCHTTCNALLQAAGSKFRDVDPASGSCRSVKHMEEINAQGSVLGQSVVSIDDLASGCFR
jgi:acyl-coenzyme A thioesterase PaaI-like protein